MKIIFATNNQHKLREVRQILDGRYEVLSLADIDCHADIPETADTLQGNALQKARYIYERYNTDVFADDTGLEVEALNGAPGVHTARYAGDAHDTQANVDKLLREMHDKTNRRACFRTAIALIKDGEEHLFEGRVDGEITTRREGDGGFGYDPVFRPEGLGGTFAQLGETVKNTISHRARAVEQLVKFLSILLLAIYLPITPSTASTTHRNVECRVMSVEFQTQKLKNSKTQKLSDDEWTLHPAYGNALQVIHVDGELWCMSSGNLWSYNLEREELSTYDRTNGLSDISISSITYARQANKLVIIYANSNVDLLDLTTRQVLNVSAICNSDIAQHNINDICVTGNEAWLATQFGIVVIDLHNGVVQNTYNYNMSVKSLTVTDGDERRLFAVINERIHSAPVGDALYDRSQLTQYSTANAKRVMWWQGRLLLIATNNRAYTIDTNGNAIMLPNQTNNLVSMQVDGDKLLLLNKSHILIFDNQLKVTTLSHNNTYTSITSTADNQYIVSDGHNGLQRIVVGGNSLVAEALGVQPNGPSLSPSTRVHYLGNRLTHTTGGGDYKGVTWYNSAFDVMDENGQWTNLERPIINATYNFPNMLDLVEDPLNPEHYYGCSYASGVLEYHGDKLHERYTGNNSSLVTLFNNPTLYTRVSSIAFDEQGNLWMLNTNTSQPIVYRTAGGEWGTMTSEIGEMKMGGDILPIGNYLLFAAKTHTDLKRIGIYCVDTKGTPSDANDDRHRWCVNPIRQQDGVEYTTHYIYTLAADHNEQIWVGTDMGLFVITSVDDMFSNNFTYQQIKVNRNDGSGLADYLFNGVGITAIAVDQANRKWIGTNGQGVYLVSHDGQQQLLHFTLEGSLLPSNLINSIAVNDITGDVAIATEQGLAIYHAGNLTANDTLDEESIVVYPNPVPGNYNHYVTILGATHGAEVKVTTVTGQVIYRTLATGGTAQWNMRDARGNRVATGVYNIIINTADGSEAVIKRLVVTN